MSKEFVCKECKSKIPDDLIEILKSGNVIFCEKCGLENRKEYFNFEVIQPVSAKEQTTTNLQNLKSKGKQAFNLIKSKISEYKDKFKEK